MSEGIGDGSAAPAGPAWLTGIERVCELIAIAALAVMVTVMTVDVVTRNFLGFSFQISDEVGGYMLVVATFFAIPVALIKGGLHKVVFVENRLAARTRLKLQIGVGLVSLFVCLVIEWQLVRYLISSFKSGSHSMTGLGTPLWLPQAAMPIGFGLFCIVLAAFVAADIRSARSPAPPADARH
jgi:TRAP-type C4-dicarboxylate transport system permease small subunit